MKLFVALALSITPIICFGTDLSELASHAKDPFIVADKHEGTITVHYPDTKNTVISPALFGKVKADKINHAKLDVVNGFSHITPSGTYKIKKQYSEYLHTSILTFIEGKDKILAIHPVWLGMPSQQRLQRLFTKTPKDNRITDGCINVPSAFFYSVLNALPDDTILYILTEDDTLIYL